MVRIHTAAAVLLTATACCLAAGGVPSQTRDLDAKLAILVDKVMQPSKGWITEEWMVKEAADAGFNVLSPRRGHERFDEVEQIAEWCRKHGIGYMPWMRGTLQTDESSAADGKRLVWANGREQPLWSPNSDRYWEWMERHIVEYARIGLQNPHLIGVFVDFENYAAGQRGKLYPLSYDEIILGRFAKANEMRLPRLAPADRHDWLESRGLHAAFAEFQVNHWGARMRALRRAVDEINPGFRFAIYPSPGGTRFMAEISQALSTRAAPIILADGSTYGRSPNHLDHSSALESNRKKLLLNQEGMRLSAVPMTYVGGVDPVTGSSTRARSTAHRATRNTGAGSPGRTMRSPRVSSTGSTSRGRRQRPATYWSSASWQRSLR